MGSTRLSGPAIAVQTAKRILRTGSLDQLQAVPSTVPQATARTSDYCHTEAEEGQERPDKYIDIEQSLGLAVRDLIASSVRMDRMHG